MKKKNLNILLFTGLLLSVFSCSPSNDTSSNTTDETISSKEEGTSENPSSSSTSSSTSSSSSKKDDDIDYSEKFTGIVRIYFHDDGGTEKNKAIYCWISGVDGTEYAWDGEEDGYGTYKDIDLSDPKFIDKVTDDFYFIIKYPATWDGQSDDIKIVLSDYLKNGEVDTLENGKKRINVFACDEGGGNYVTYYHKADALGFRFATATVEKDWKTLKVSCTGKCVSYSLYALDGAFAAKKISVTDPEANLSSYLIKEDKPNVDSFELDLTSLSYPTGRAVTVRPNLTFMLIGHFEDAPEKTKTKAVSFDKLFDTDKFISDYTYSGDDLGVTYSKERTEWKLWSPLSVKADLVLYKDGTPKALVTDNSGGWNDFAYKVESMRYDSNGVYVAALKGDWSGYFYQYRLYYNGTYVDTPDPYATSCGLNGVRSAVTDFSSLNPTGWDDISYPALSSPTELTPYEVHIRDLTSHSTWISRKGNERGGYNAFHEKGTGFNGVKTGFDHIKELGVNAVQLLPVFDQDNDERTLTDKNGIVHKPNYNWGYNPANYNCVEGSYSSKPSDPNVRVKEFKSLVKDCADEGIRVIMDVVYNHVSSISTHPFSLSMPHYYFRYNEDGTTIDDTGCANTINSSRIMVERFIVNSVKWWAKEYKIKGFRFDLMGVLETSTMRAVKDALYDIDPEIVVYGEGWTGGGSHASSPSNTDNIYAKLGDNGKGAVGSFNDCYRDGMKGNTLYADVVPSGGFMDSYAPSSDQIWNAATGMIGENRWKKQGGAKTPAAMSVNYISCHDNYTLYDQFNYLLNGISNCEKENKNAKDAALAAQVNAFMGQGIGFIQGGEEIFRSKIIHKDNDMFDTFVKTYQHKSNGTNSWIEGDGVKINDNAWLVRNSYKYGDEVNAFDWSRKVDNEDYFAKFKEAIALRKSSFGTYLGMSQEEIENGGTTCLGGTAIGGGFVSKEGNNRLVITTGRKLGVLNNIPSTLQGTYKVVYCSSSRLEEGNEYIVKETLETNSTFETLILEKNK